MESRKVITLLFLVCSMVVGAQTIELSFGSSSVSISDSVAVGDTVWYKCWVVNNGNSVIYDHIALNAARNCPVHGLENEREIGHINPFALFPGDSLEFPAGLFYEVAQQQNYTIGDNIVVIWPKVNVPTMQINEHLSASVYVQSSSMISGGKNIESVRNNFFIFTNNTINFVKEVSVKEFSLYNILGKKVMKKVNPNRAVCLEILPKGTYFIVVKFSDGSISKDKIIVQ